MRCRKHRRSSASSRACTRSSSSRTSSRAGCACRTRPGSTGSSASSTTSRSRTSGSSGACCRRWARSTSRPRSGSSCSGSSRRSRSRSSASSIEGGPMALTPVEIMHMTPGKGLFGYKRAQTDQLLSEIAASFEDVWRERADLADKIDQLEADLGRYRELESLLRTTLVSAERASAELKEQARKEAELILSEAHAEARSVKRQALAEHERLATEARVLRQRLRAALDAVGETEEAAHREAA